MGLPRHPLRPVSHFQELFQKGFGIHHAGSELLELFDHSPYAPDLIPTPQCLEAIARSQSACLQLVLSRSSSVPQHSRGASIWYVSRSRVWSGRRRPVSSPRILPAACAHGHHQGYPGQSWSNCYAVCDKTISSSLDLATACRFTIPKRAVLLI